MNNPVAFDLDGTLLNSLQRHFIVLQDCLIINGFSKEASAINDLIDLKREGFSTKEYLGIKGFDKSDQLLTDWLERIETPHYLQHDHLYSGVNNILKQLSCEHPLILVTARSNKEGVRLQLERLAIANYFTQVIIVNPGKNASEKKATATKRMGIRCVFGDTETDYAWATEIAADFLPLNWGMRSKQWWGKCGVDSFGDLSDAVKSAGFII